MGKFKVALQQGYEGKFLALQIKAVYSISFGFTFLFIYIPYKCQYSASHCTSTSARYYPSLNVLLTLMVLVANLTITK